MFSNGVDDDGADFTRHFGQTLLFRGKKHKRTISPACQGIDSCETWTWTVGICTPKSKSHSGLDYYDYEDDDFEDDYDDDNDDNNDNEETSKKDQTERATASTSKRPTNTTQQVPPKASNTAPKKSPIAAPTFKNPSTGRGITTSAPLVTLVKPAPKSNAALSIQHG